MVVLSAVCFSAKAIFAKLAYRLGADASTVLTLRMAVALPFFAAGAVAAERRAGARLARGEIVRLVLLGSVGYYLASVFDFVGLKYVSAGLERLILFLYPTLVVLLGAVFFRERLSARIALAMALSYGGVALVFLSDRASGGADVVYGCFLVFLGALAYAFYLAFSQPLIARHGSTRVTSHVLVVACLCVIAQFTLEGDFERLAQPADVYLLAGATGVVATVLPAFLLTAGIKRLGASRAALIGTIGPVSTILLAYVFLGEPLTALQIAGSALVLAGVWQVSRPAAPPAEAPAPAMPEPARAEGAPPSPQRSQA